MNTMPGGCAACRSAQQVFAFSMAFRPVVDVSEGRIDAYEALVRGPAGERAGQVLAQVSDEGAEIGIRIVLEGVEALRSVGGRFMQGFHFARPAFERIAHDDVLWTSLPGRDVP
jgi:EAL domain-containing protein (putative c-di-GMP-specific phosphodiesterase class I)